MNSTYVALRQIEAADPDGGETEPTEADYANHQRWAIETYGRAVWEQYRQSGWGETHYDDF